MQVIDCRHHLSANSFNDNPMAVMYEKSLRKLVGYTYNGPSRCASAVTFNLKYHYVGSLHAAPVQSDWQLNSLNSRYHQHIIVLCVCDKFSEFHTAVLCSSVLKYLECRHCFHDAADN